MPFESAGHSRMPEAVLFADPFPLAERVRATNG